MRNCKMEDTISRDYHPRRSPANPSKIFFTLDSMLLHPISLTYRYLSRDDLYGPLDELLYVTTLDEKYLPTQGLLQPLSTIATDIAPLIRYILLHEHQCQKFPVQQISLDALWTNTRATRKQVKAAQEGKRKYFGDKVDAQAVLRTWIYTGDSIA